MLDALIGIAYLSISISLIRFVQKSKLPYLAAFVALGLTIFVCGGIHFLEIAGLWSPNEYFAKGFRALTATVSIVTASILFFTVERFFEKHEGKNARLSWLAKTAKDDAKRSDLFLESILENIPNMVFVKEAKTLKFVRLNRAGEKALGLTRNQVEGHTDHELFPRALAQSYTQLDRQVLKTNSVTDIPEEFVKTAEGMRVFHTRKIPIFDENGVPEYLLGISDDITDWKIAQEERLKVFGEKIALEERELGTRQAEFLAEVTTLLASSFDYRANLKTLAARLTDQLCTWCTIALKTDDEMIERIAASHREPGKLKLIDELMSDVPLRLDDQIQSPIVTVLKTGESVHEALVDESYLTRNSQSARHSGIAKDLGCLSIIVVPVKATDHVYGTIAMVSGNADKLYNERDLAIAEEIGKRAAVCVQNAKLYEEVQEAVRSRDEFLSIASHELKTPLTALKLQLEFARRQTKPDENIALSAEKIVKVLDTSNAQVDRLVALVDDLLDVTRIESGRLNFNFEVLDLVELVREVSERFQNQILKSGSPFNLRLPPEPLMVFADRFRMEQVVLNILSNATKYGSGKQIELEVHSNDTSVTVVCRDQGIGIAPGKLEKIFERFERAIEASNISGLGLGLYIAHEIVVAHDGQIRVESALNSGSSFMVGLPLMKRETS